MPAGKHSRVTIDTQPAHGTAEVVIMSIALSPASGCPGVVGKAAAVQYTSGPGFAGADHFSVSYTFEGMGRGAMYTKRQDFDYDLTIAPVAAAKKRLMHAGGGRPNGTLRSRGAAGPSADKASGRS